MPGRRRAREYAMQALYAADIGGGTPTAALTGLWQQRFEQNNAFEKYLVQNGTQIVKLFLNVSKEEQRDRQLERIADRFQRWKASRVGTFILGSMDLEVMRFMAELNAR